VHAGAAARILAAGPGRLRNLELGKTVEGVWVHAPAVRSWVRPTHLRRSAQAGGQPFLCGNEILTAQHGIYVRHC